MESLEEKIARVLKDRIELSPYSTRWPKLFEEEKQHLRSLFPETIGKIEHFGSTAVPGLWAKPVVDILVEIPSLDEAEKMIVPVLEQQGYDYFKRSVRDDKQPPFYAWFIKRDANGVRTHHLHMVEADSELWKRLLFRDYLIAHPATAWAYQELKLRLALEASGDRIAYTRGKTEFVNKITLLAK